MFLEAKPAAAALLPGHEVSKPSSRSVTVRSRSKARAEDAVTVSPQTVVDMRIMSASSCSRLSSDSVSFGLTGVRQW